MNDLKVPFHKSELLEHEKANLAGYIADIIESGMFTNGQYLERLEAKIAEISNKKFAVVFSSGTAALYCAVKALGIKGVIITTPLTWIATTNAIEEAGCHPVYYDVNDNGLMDMPRPPAGFTRSDIEDTYGGVMPVSLYGQEMNYGDYEPYHFLPMILDACHSINQINFLDEKGLFDILCFSLHPTKLFFAGEGGFALTNWENLAQMMKMFRYHGLDENKLRREQSIKFTMPEFSAACALVTMESYDKRVSLQRKKIRQYLDAFDSHLKLINHTDVISSLNCTMMTIEVRDDRRDDLMKHMIEAGYGVDVKYPDLLYNMNSVARDSYPRTKELTRNVLTYPCYPTLGEKHIEEMAEETAKFFEITR